MINKVRISILLLLTIFIMLNQGCSYINLKTLIPENTVRSAPIQTASIVTPTEEVMVVQSTVTPTKSLRVTPTINNTSTPSYTEIIETKQTPTLTPLPTIPAENIQAFLYDLLLNNNGCRLPCWWGITPGKTDWQTALQFLQTFTSGISHDNDTPNLYNESHGNINRGDIFGITRYYLDNEKIISIIAGPTDTEIGYELNQLLENYGEPDEVELYTYPDYLSHGQLPLYLFIQYDEESITAIYEYEAEIIGDKIQVCPGLQTVGPRLILGKLMTPFDIQSYPKKPLIVATDKSTSDFYQAYVNPRSQICLQTPKDIWEWP